MIDGFQFHHHKTRMQAKNRILRLLDLTFLKQGTNLVLIGNRPRFWMEGLSGKSACPVHNRDGYAESPRGFPGRSFPGAQAQHLLSFSENPSGFG